MWNTRVMSMSGVSGSPALMRCSSKSISAGCDTLSYIFGPMLLKVPLHNTFTVLLFKIHIFSHALTISITIAVNPIIRATITLYDLWTNHIAWIYHSDPFVSVFSNDDASDLILELYAYYGAVSTNLKVMMRKLLTNTQPWHNGKWSQLILPLLIKKQLMNLLLSCSVSLHQGNIPQEWKSP